MDFELFTVSEITSYNKAKLEREHNLALKQKLAFAFKHSAKDNLPKKYTNSHKALYNEIFFDQFAAKDRINHLADQNFGETFYLYEDDKPEPHYSVKRYYKWDDPVWQAIPTIEQCREIWLHFLKRLVIDAVTTLNPDTEEYSNQVVRKSDKEAATRYMNMNNDDFKLICEFAGLEPEYIIRKLKEA